MRRGLQGGELVVATHNPGKLREIAALLAPHGVRAVSAAALALPEPEETGASFVENAAIKAEAAVEGSGRPALADDSGLVVPALDGAPGIHSARWAGPERDFAAAMAELERRLAGRADRAAHFLCVLCLAWPDGHREVFEGRVDGHLVWPPRGSGGFGYDPMFQPEGCDQTFGEMPPALKQGLSHRARALRRLLAECLER